MWRGSRWVKSASKKPAPMLCTSEKSQVSSLLPQRPSTQLWAQQTGRYRNFPRFRLGRCNAQRWQIPHYFLPVNGDCLEHHVIPKPRVKSHSLPASPSYPPFPVCCSAPTLSSSYSLSSAPLQPTTLEQSNRPNMVRFGSNQTFFCCCWNSSRYKISQRRNFLR